MRKVAILTINDNFNFGNRLQNYAVQEVLKTHHLDVETIINRGSIVGINFLKYEIRMILVNLKRDDNSKKLKKFLIFNDLIKGKKHIDISHISSKIIDEFSLFFTGSDQVWNPNFGRMSDIDFLCFADKSKRNSFSASFGISEIPEEMQDYYRENLKSLNHISVREDAGKKIIEDLTGRTDVEVLVDPTMLLTAEEWDTVSKEPEQISKLNGKKYILNYFLGDLSEQRKKEISRIAKENDCEIINILDKNDLFYVSGPSEFLWLEKNAFLICTDSFHSSVFAILFNKPFIVFNREDELENMNSRLETLLSKFELNDRYYNGKITDELLSVDYTKTYKLLELERKKADDFINRCLNNEGENI